MVKETADVVIIGAGIIGCSTAYHLAKLGIRDVAIVEMGEAGSGSSSKSASMLSLQFGRDALVARMAQYSYARYMDFEAELGAPIGFKKIGWLSIATNTTGEILLEHARLLQSLGISTDILDQQGVRELYPEMEVEDVVVGTWGPDDGIIDAHMILWGYARRGREMGMRLYQGVRALGIQVQNNCVTAVLTDKGPILTGVIVNAGGPWTAEIGNWIGVEIPIQNSRRSIAVTGPIPDLPARRPFVEDLTGEWYFRPEGEGLLMGMGDVPSKAVDFHLDKETVTRLIETSMARMPILQRTSLLTAWTGIRPLTADGRPILGMAPDLSGFWLNCGWGGMGIIQAPAAGQLLAELISTGQTSSFETGPFQLSRFFNQCMD